MRLAVPAAKIRVRKISALPRQRLTALLPDLRKHGLGLVVAPAGSGKTTFAAQIAAAADGPVAWYAAEQSDGDENVFLTRLEHAFALAIPELGGSWKTVEAAAAALEGLERQRKPALLVVDDFHLLQGTPGRGRVRAPARVRARRADRPDRLAHPPALQPLAPSRLGLAARARPGRPALPLLGGRAAVQPALRRPAAPGGARPAHTAHRGLGRRPPALPPGHARQGAERAARTLAALRARWKLVREYLASNVLHELDPDLRELPRPHLGADAALGRGSATSCSAARAASEVLEQLERRQIFTVSLDDQGHYRYHEVLRSQLEATYVDAPTTEEARAHYRKAGRLLEEDGALPDALRAYSRAEDREAVARLLGRRRGARRGRHRLDRPAARRARPPRPLAPARARAREERAAGRLARAIAAYDEAERGFGRAAAAEICRRERLAVAAWIEPAFVPSSDSGSACCARATIRDPVAVRRKATRLPGPGARLAGGLAALVAGQLADAIDLLGGAEQDPESRPDARGRRAPRRAVAMLLCGDEVKGAVEADLAAEEAERIGLSCARADRPRGARAPTGPTGAPRPPRPPRPRRGRRTRGASRSPRCSRAGARCGPASASAGRSSARSTSSTRSGAAVLEAWARAAQGARRWRAAARPARGGGRAGRVGRPLRRRPRGARLQPTSRSPSSGATAAPSTGRSAAALAEETSLCLPGLRRAPS